MNRRLDCATALLVFMLVALPARGQVTLVAGSVRDQHGAPVEGAIAAARTPGGAKIAAVTDAAGTFVMRAEVASISITCRFCRPASVTVQAGQPVVAIVWRYDALAQTTPSHGDLENLPYAHVESAVALRPFTLLAQNSLPYVGSSLSDRGLSSGGGLLVDNGVPNYDIVSGSSPYTLVPATYEQGADVFSAANAFLYGDRAAGGIVTLDPFASGSNEEVALLGSDVIARAQVGSQAAAIAAGTYSNNEESRQRTDLSGNVSLGDGKAISVSGGTEQGRVYESPATAFAGSFSFGNATFTDSSLLNLSVSALADRGTYANELTTGYGASPISEAWSDTGLSAGVHTTGAVSGFADLATRWSTGLYDAQALPFGLPRVGAMTALTRADAGVAARGTDYLVLAGLGTYWINYSGGTYGVSQPAKVTLTEPSIQATLFPNGKWSLNLEDGGSFTLPTYYQQYQYAEAEPLPLQYQRNALLGGSLSYTDDSRLRVAFEAAQQTVRGASSGTVSSVGLSAAWQVSPDIALRAWTMHVTDTVPVYGYGAPYEGAAPTVGALWLTYDASSALRVDAIYRRDLLDTAPFYHFDGAISGPIANRLRWYAGAEDRMHRTFLDVGVRYSGD